MIQLRPKFRCLRIFCIAIAIFAGVDGAARDLGTLSLEIREADPAHPRVMLLAGSWPDRCVPQFLKSSRDRNDLTLQLHAPSHDCVAGSTPFQLPIEVRTAFGTSAPERQVYRVRITLSHGDEAEQLIGFRLLDLGAMPVQPESGFWWSRSRPGDTAPALAGGGIGLEVQGNQLALSLLAFTADGTPTWYFGSADMNGRVAQVPLIRLINGGGSNKVNGRSAGIEQGPLLALDFAGPTEARAWLLGPLSSISDAPLGLQPLLLHRAIFDARVTGSSWLGSWVLVQGDQTRLLRMSRIITDDGESFRLIIDSGNAAPTSLNCRYRGSGSGAEVEGCSLIESGRVSASFGQIGIDRLIGSSADGRSAQLLRLQP
ncbi:MAG: hypothetical protein ABIR16_03245 [Dokdonella sp.]